jgi:hypothetical protein
LDVAVVAEIRKLDSVSFDQFLDDYNPFEQAEPRFNLRGVTLVTPGALVPMAAACHALAGSGRTPVITVDDFSVRSYLLRCGFTAMVSQVATFDPPYSSFMSSAFESRRGRNPMLMELTKIEHGSALPALLDQVVWVLKHRLKYQKYDAYDVATAMSEICQNTFDHNLNTCGFMAMQGYGQGVGRFIEIAVADSGEGLRATLSRNAKNGLIRSDSQAIQMATTLGTSQYDDPTRGTGLYHLLEIAYKHQGSVQFRSGSAKTRFRMDTRRGWSFQVSPMPGLQITLTLRSKERA